MTVEGLQREGLLLTVKGLFGAESEPVGGSKSGAGPDRPDAILLSRLRSQRVHDSPLPHDPRLQGPIRG